MQIGQIIFAQVDAIEQNAAFGGIVETGDQLDDGGLALAVLADQCHALSGAKREVEAVEDAAARSRIGKRDIAKLKSKRDRARHEAARQGAISRPAPWQRTPADR